MQELTEGYKDLILVVAVPGLYCLMVLAGRRLKRQHGVRLGKLYHLFSLSLAVYLPALLLNMNWAFLRHLGAAVVILGACVVIALVDRYLWDLYFQQRHRIKVPKFLTEVVGVIILIVAIFLVLQIGYDQSIKALLIAPGIAAVIIGLAAQDLVGQHPRRGRAANRQTVRARGLAPGGQPLRGSDGDQLARDPLANGG